MKEYWQRYIMKKGDSAQRNQMEKREHSPRVTQKTWNPQDSIHRIRTNPNRRTRMDMCQVNGREYIRWCLVADTWKNILPIQNVYQDPVLKTKEAESLRRV